MQAWWISYSYEDGVQWQLQNSLRVYVAVTSIDGELSWTIYDKVGKLTCLTIEQAKEIVAKRFAVMLCELAATVLTVAADAA